MSVYTTLEFFRTKQTVDSFEQSYPKSIKGLREAVLGSLQSIDDVLTELTMDYLDGYSTHDAFIRDKIITVHLLLTETNMDGIYKKSDFDSVCDRAGASMNEYVNKLKSICSHVSKFNPNSFTPVVELFEKIIGCMEKYFLSFYDGSIHTCPSAHVRSPFNYENYKRQIIHDVKEKLRAIYDLTNRFSKEDISVNDMGENSKHLARKTKCVDMPFFMIFHESGELISEAKKMLLQWIEADIDYTRTLKTDIATIREEEKTLDLKRRTNYDECIKMKHNLDQLQREYTEMNILKPIMQQKLRQTENRHYESLICLKTNELIIEKAHHVINDRTQKSDLTEVSSEITDQQYILEKNKRTLKDNKLKLRRIENKIKWYQRFSIMHSEKFKELEVSRTELEKVKRLVEEDDEKLKTLRLFIDQLQKMYLYKSSHVTLKKIFHNLDMGNRLSYLSKSKDTDNDIQKDHLSTAIEVTSKLINKDWITLYINLPFHPPRGNTEIENDISKFSRFQVRGLDQDVALQSLKTWRRMHIRANVLSLISALEKINRFDISKKIDVGPKESPQMSIRRLNEVKLPPMSATTRFLIKHYPNLELNRTKLTS